MRLVAAVLAFALAGTGTLREGPIQFRYWPGGERLAQHLAALVRGFTRLPGLPPDVLYAGRSVEIDLAPDPARWDSLTGGGAPAWGVGIAVPEEGRIVLPAYGRAPPLELGEILRHEIAHVALHRFLGGALVPRWFDEGYATWASGGLDANAAWILRLAFLMHRAPALSDLDLDWPAPEAEARLAYLLSASAVSLLAERRYARRAWAAPAGHSSSRESRGGAWWRRTARRSIQAERASIPPLAQVAYPSSNQRGTPAGAR